MRNEIQFTDDQIEDLFQRAHQIGITVDDLVFTRDTLGDFDSACNHYASCGVPNYTMIAGLKTLCIPKAQPRKGDQRRDVYIIDFGTVRGVYK